MSEQPNYKTFTDWELDLIGNGIWLSLLAAAWGLIQNDFWSSIACLSGAGFYFCLHRLRKGMLWRKHVQALEEH